MAPIVLPEHVIDEIAIVKEQLKEISTNNNAKTQSMEQEVLGKEHMMECTLVSAFYGTQFKVEDPMRSHVQLSKLI